MTWIVNLLFVALMQTPAPPVRVTVGLTDGQCIVVENPEFSGFIQGRNGEAVLIYREAKFHGQLPIPIISKIEFGAYKRGEPFAMSVTLKNGQNLHVESEYRSYVTLRGRTDLGMVTITHPDPTSFPVNITSKKPNRVHDLTIQYLEFGATTG
jgi:hypothetical protein